MGEKQTLIHPSDERYREFLTHQYWRNRLAGHVEGSLNLGLDSK